MLAHAPARSSRFFALFLFHDRQGGIALPLGQGAHIAVPDLLAQAIP